MNLLLRQLLLLVLLGLAGGKALCAEGPDAANTPPTPSPIEDFRQLLRAEGEQREKMLEAWPTAKQQVLRRKCEFYDKLPSAERERRLRMLELRWYLLPLMSKEAPERAVALSGIPQDFQHIVNERLAQWDQLPADARKQFLDNEMALQYFTRVQQSSPDSQRALDPVQRQKMDEKLAAWRNLSPRERQRSYQRFNRYFELPREEQEKTLHVLSETERKEMEKTLEAFAKLPPEQRRVSIDSFRKFANMSSVERNEFFRNVQRWQSMSPGEREQWRSLVNNLPPMPGDADLPPIPRSSRNGVNSNTVGN